MTSLKCKEVFSTPVNAKEIIVESSTFDKSVSLIINELYLNVSWFTTSKKYCRPKLSGTLSNPFLLNDP